MSNVKSILEAIDREYTSFDIGGSASVNGKTYLFNSAYYLKSREEIEALQKCCAEYLSHIDNSIVSSHNADLLKSRKEERVELIKEIPKKKTVDTFIYLMYNRQSGYYKIGRSKEPQIRENTLQSQEPTVQLIFSAPGTCAMEKELHREYHAKRMRGEWFDLTQEDINYIIEKMNRRNGQAY